MLWKQTAGDSTASRRSSPHARGHVDRTQADVAFLRPGRSPAILGATVLVFLVLGTLLTSRIEQPTTSNVDRQLAQEAQARREVDTLATALERFRADTGRYPTQAEGLTALVQNPGLPEWDGHYVNLIQPDPWNTPYRYVPDPVSPEIRSAGPDRTFGTDQDIYSVPPAPDP